MPRLDLGRGVYSSPGSSVPQFRPNPSLISDMRSLARWFVPGLAALGLSASAAQAASITGLVRDAETGSALANASVRIAELNRTVTTGPDGRFSFVQVPAGSYTLVAETLGRDEVAQPVVVGEDEAATADLMLGSGTVTLGRFVVEGIREGQARALRQKRAANNILDTVSADAVGKFPDGNAAEALRRVPGVSLEIDQSEGRYVVVRGIDSSLNNVTLNGQLVGSPSEGGNRGLAMDSVPADLISRLEVVKAVTPDMDANAIGGSINIVTQSPYDRDEGFFLATLTGGYNDFSGRWPYGGSFSYGRILDEAQRWGVVIGASYSFRDFSSQTSDALNWRERNGYFVPEVQESFDYNIERERLGVNAALSLRPRPGHELSLRINHNVFTDEEGRQKAGYTFGLGTLSDQTPTTGRYSQGRSTREFRDYKQVHTIDAASLTGEHELSPEMQLTWQAGVSRGERDTPRRVDWEFRSAAGAFPNTYDLSGEFPIITPSAAFYDPAAYPFRRVRFRTDLEQEDVYSGQVDLRRDTVVAGYTGYWKVGAKWVSRDKTQDRNNTNYTLAGPAFTLAEGNLAGIEPSGYFEGAYRFGPTINLPAMQSFFAANSARFAHDAVGSLVDSSASDFDGSEDVLAGYVMASVDLTPQVTLLGGLRVEQTDTTFSANELVYDDGTFTGQVNRVRGGKDYTNVLPGLHLNWRLNDRWVVRAAWTNTLGRPNYVDLAPRRTFDQVDLGDGTWEGSLSTGNPELKPYESMNFDVSAEYYLKNAGILSVGVFHKQIDNPVYAQEFTQNNVTVDGRTYQRLDYEQPANADRGEISGLEFNYQQFFDFLPAPFDGFGVNLNYTITDSSVRVFGRDDKLPFFKQSDEIGNVALIYEKHGLEARVALSFNTAYLDSVGASAAEDNYIARRRPVDVKVSYRIHPKARVFVEFLNVDEQPLRSYAGDTRRSSGHEIYSWNANFGISLNL